MFYLFFTTPAENNRKYPENKGRKKVSRSRFFITWLLIFTWFILISFAGVSIVNPEWLDKAGQYGKERSVNVLKGFGDNCLRQKKYKMAIEQYKRALEIQPDHVGTLVNIATAFARTGDHTRGIRILFKTLENENARKEDIYYNIAEILEGQNNMEDAIRYYEKAANSKYNQDMVYRKLGIVYFAIGNYEKSREAFEKLLAIQTDPHTLYIDMLHQGAVVYKGDTTHQRVIENQLARLKDVEYLTDYDLKSILDVQKRDRKIAQTHNHLGIIYSRLGDLAKSADHFNQSLDIWPANREATTNLSMIEQAIKAREQTDLSQR
jgi:tetratricopeptide (TPR) repeat protein